MLSPDKLFKAETLLAEPLLGRLATSNNDQPHVIPVWYIWEDGAAWISAYESTRKIRELKANPKCALVVDVQRPDSSIVGVLLEGRAILLREPHFEVLARIERIYMRYLGEEGVKAKDPQEWLHSPENILIKLVPQKMMVW